MVPRKSGKTLLAAGLAWGLSFLERASGSSMYITAASLKQAMQSFEDIFKAFYKKERGTEVEEEVLEVLLNLLGEEDEDETH